MLDVKAFRLFTGHHTQPAVLPKDIRVSLPAERTATGKNVYYKDVPAPRNCGAATGRASSHCV